MVIPLFVSYHTTDYADVSSRLEASLKKFNLAYELRPIEDTGSWVKNCAKKPRFLGEMMLRHPNRPIIWIDSDAVVQRMPVDLLDAPASADAMVCRYTWKRRKVTEVLSGTVYLKNNPESLRLVDQWAIECDENPEMWDQRCLEVAISKVPACRVAQLHVSYCFVSDFHRQDHPDMLVVVEHFQKSRETRGKRPTA